MEQVAKGTVARNCRPLSAAYEDDTEAWKAEFYAEHCISSVINRSRGIVKLMRVCRGPYSLQVKCGRNIANFLPWRKMRFAECLRPINQIELIKGSTESIVIVHIHTGAIAG
jgi:hypothetical protein